jgi:hypothetical protein
VARRPGLRGSIPPERAIGLTDTGPLIPAMRSTFTAGDGVLQIVRDKSGRVTGMTLSASRMRGIEFEKIDK